MAGLTNGTASQLPRKRRRPAVVCAECRRRKIACDRKTPCGQCALHKVECVYVTGAVPPPYGRPVRATTSPGRNATGSSVADGSDGSGIPIDTTAAVTTTITATGAGTATATVTASPLDEPDDDDRPGAPPQFPISAMGERSTRFGGRLAKTRLFGRTHWANNMDEVGSKSGCVLESVSFADSCSSERSTV